MNGVALVAVLGSESLSCYVLAAVVAWDRSDVSLPVQVLTRTWSRERGDSFRSTDRHCE
jgi:hypothetical protein